MSWVKIDDHFADHPKVVSAGPLASWLHVKAMTYCSRYLTDGKITRAVALSLVSWDDVAPLQSAYTTDSMTSEMVNSKLIDRLLDSGIWEPVDGGYLIHDYLEYNPSRDTVLQEREIAKERMRKLRGAGTLKTNNKASSENVRQNFVVCSPTPDPDPDPDPISDPPVVPQEGDPPPLKLEAPEPVQKPDRKTKRERMIARWRTTATEVLLFLSSERKKAKPGSQNLAAIDANLVHIAGRLEDGYTAAECKHVIEICAAEFRANKDTWQWFNQVTPFRPDNFAMKLGNDANGVTKTSTNMRIIEPTRPRPPPAEEVIAKYRVDDPAPPPWRAAGWTGVKP